MFPIILCTSISHLGLDSSATKTSQHSSDQKSDGDLSTLDIKLDDLETSHERFPARHPEIIAVWAASTRVPLVDAH